MKKSIIAIIVSAIMIVSFNISAFAGNSKTDAGSIVNPAGQIDKNGFDNGNAWWKQEIENCHNDNDGLIDENNELYDRIADLENQLVEAKAAAAPVMKAMEQAEPVVMETIKFNLQKHQEETPNVNQAGSGEIYMLLRSFDEDLFEQIMNSMDGEYTVNINLSTPDSQIDFTSTFWAEDQERSYRDKFIKVVR